MTTETALTVIERASVALGSSALEIHLKDLVKKNADIVAIANKDGREQVHIAAMVLRKQRTDISKTGKDARDDAAKFCKAVIEEEKRLIAIIEPEECRFIKMRDDWDAEREAEKQAAIAKEAARRKHIEEMIGAIRNTVFVSPREASAGIEAIIAATEALDVSEASYEEFAPAAARAKAETLESLRETLEMAKRNEADQARIKAEQEAEAARLAAEREELARLRAEADERQRIADEQAAEARRVEEAKLAEERAAIARQREQQEAENLARQMELDRQAAEIRKIQQERAEIDRKAAEAKARAELEEANRIAEAKRAEAAAELERQMKEQAEAARLAREGQIPLRSEIIDVIAGRYDVSPDAAERWLVELFAVEVA